MLSIPNKRGNIRKNSLLIRMSDKAIQLRVALVPEQINIPLQICVERGIFSKYNIEVELKEVGEGTGRMIDLLEKNEVDIAMTVTDAFIANKAKGRKISLCGTYATSPLIWAAATKYIDGKENCEKVKVCLYTNIRVVVRVFEKC